MNTLDQTVEYIAHRLLAGRYDIHGRELVALIGTGSEADNLAATYAWVLVRTEEHAPLAAHAVGWLREIFDDYLEDLLDNFHQDRGVMTEFASDLPLKSLTDTECQRLAEAIAHLVAGSRYRDKLEAAVGLMLDKPASSDRALYRWVREQTDCYVFYPSELTLPLARRLKKKLLTLG